MEILLALCLLSQISCGCSSQEKEPEKPQCVYRPRWAAPSENREDSQKPPIVPKAFAPPPVETSQPVLRRMDALTLSSSTNPNRSATTPHTSKKTPIKKDAKK